MRLTASNILWVDCSAAILAGVVTLVFRDWLAALYAIPVEGLMATALVNLIYGSYSFSLAWRDRPPILLVRALALANALWAPVCVGLVLYWWPTVTGFGMIHLLGEAGIVMTLAFFEWRWQHRLSRRID